MRRLLLVVLGFLCVGLLNCREVPKNLRTFAWNTTLLQTTLEYSAASHCSEGTLQDWSCSHCYGHVSWIGSRSQANRQHPSIQRNLTSTASLLLTTTTNYVPTAICANFCSGFAAYRGTDFGDLMNDYIDFDFLFIWNYSGIPDAAVHSGFYQAYLALQDQHLAGMQKCVTTYPGYTTILETGHSLGAAIANFAAVDIVKHFPSHSLFIYNYGDPRVGNQAFAQYFDSVVPNVWRVVNERDPVPHLPPLLADFWQIETEVWYWNSNFTFCTEGDGEDPNCSDSLDWFDPGDHGTYLGVDMGCDNPSTTNTKSWTTNTVPPPRPSQGLRQNIDLQHKA